MRKRTNLLALTGLVAVLAFPNVLFAEGRVTDLTASDGVKLKATFYASAKPGPGVLLLHQCNGVRQGWEPLAEKLSAAGINVLTVDNRGFGESGGNPHDKNTPQQEGQVEREKWPGDFDVAYNYLIAQPGVVKDKIGVGGASCGVDNAVKVAQRHPEVKSLVLLAGPTDANGRKFLRVATNVPVLVSVADDDEFKPTILITQWLYYLAGDREKKFVPLKTGGHGTETFAPHPEFVAEIVDWFVTTLIKTPGHAPVGKATMPAEVVNLEKIDVGGAAKLAKDLEEARRKDPKAQIFPEAEVNFMGYEHMFAGDNKGAIDILKLNAQAYPNSPNVYDSLSDAYLADGQKELAAQNAEKALELLKTDTVDDEQRRDGIKQSAEGKLKQLKPESQK